jgi:hypothetical protein
MEEPAFFALDSTLGVGRWALGVGRWAFGVKCSAFDFDPDAIALET